MPFAALAVFVGMEREQHARRPRNRHLDVMNSRNDRPRPLIGNSALHHRLVEVRRYRTLPTGVYGWDRQGQAVGFRKMISEPNVSAKLIEGIMFGIAHDDVLRPAPDQGEQTQVLRLAAVEEGDALEQGAARIERNSLREDRLGST